MSELENVRLCQHTDERYKRSGNISDVALAYRLLLQRLRNRKPNGTTRHRRLFVWNQILEASRFPYSLLILICFIVAEDEIEESKRQKENSMMIEFEFVDIFLLLTLTAEDYFVSGFFAHSSGWIVFLGIP